MYSHPYQLFALSKHMVSTLVRLARENRIQVEDPVLRYEKPVYRFRENEPMEFLEKNLFRYQAGTFEEEQDAIHIHGVKNPWEESLAAAGAIRRMVREEGMRFREIGVIASNMEVYGDYLKRAFDLYDIPVFMDHKRNILLNSFVEYIRSLLNMAHKNFTDESVFRFLRTGLA